MRRSPVASTQLRAVPFVRSRSAGMAPAVGVRVAVPKTPVEEPAGMEPLGRAKRISYPGTTPQFTFWPEENILLLGVVPMTQAIQLDRRAT